MYSRIIVLSSREIRMSCAINLLMNSELSPPPPPTPPHRPQRDLSQCRPASVPSPRSCVRADSLRHRGLFSPPNSVGPRQTCRQIAAEPPGVDAIVIRVNLRRSLPRAVRAGPVNSMCFQFHNPTADELHGVRGSSTNGEFEAGSHPSKPTAGSGSDQRD